MKWKIWQEKFEYTENFLPFPKETLLAFSFSFNQCSMAIATWPRMVVTIKKVILFPFVVRVVKGTFINYVHLKQKFAKI